jgi:transcriptional regulator with XRE-family HTH domain
MLSLLTAVDVQLQLSQAVKDKRKSLKLSRQALAEKSTVPSATIKKFETTGQISLRQFILLWQCIDSLKNLAAITKSSDVPPATIEQVLKS